MYLRKTSWWRTLIMAGIGTGDELSDTPVSNIPSGVYNLDDGNTSSLRVPRGVIDSMPSADQQQHNSEKCQQSINETTTGKCVTLQQYKEQGAPKYAVVTK